MSHRYKEFHLLSILYIMNRIYHVENIENIERYVKSIKIRNMQYIAILHWTL